MRSPILLGWVAQPKTRHWNPPGCWVRTGWGDRGRKTAIALGEKRGAIAGKKRGDRGCIFEEKSDRHEKGAIAIGGEERGDPGWVV
ncbi:MAG: hypothetical protein DCF22_17560 [Leptolyngbya sp.]|nr:MAG: hypothetical protein DCF22_17560 [Leptolyngbya sp.]